MTPDRIHPDSFEIIDRCSEPDAAALVGGIFVALRVRRE